MSATRDPDAILAAWLDEGPSRLPSATRRAIAVGIRSTRQARGWFAQPAWRNDMLRFQWLAGVAVVAIVAFVGVVAVMALRPLSGGVPASPTPSASPSPSPVVPLVPTPFVSARHGYTIQYPSGWSVAPATEPWPYGASHPLPMATDAADDVFSPPLGPIVSQIIVTSQALPTGVSGSAWRDAYVAKFPTSVRDECIPATDRWDHMTVDGVDVARFEACGWVTAMAFSGGRAYLFTVTSANGTSIAIFDQVLRTLVFHPEAANDTPPSASPTQ